MGAIYIREATLRYRGPRRGLSFDAVTSPDKAAQLLRRVLPDNVREHFVILFLDNVKQVVGYYVVATGTASACVVGAKELFQAAIVAGAGSLILGHNHPSGQIIPSAEDRAITKRLGEAGDLLGIPVLDHLIIGNPGFYSFHDSEGIPAKRGT
ncbi:MAG: JAB domain-containing protein [Verrucomicrobia bacterium]|nr:JAB domain-containing protein [Verrucomicrobiota bacterium]